MTAPEIVTILAAMIGLLGSLTTGIMVYRAERAKTAAALAATNAESARQSVSSEAARTAAINMQAEQLRQGLLDDNRRLTDRVGRLEERTQSLENENIRLRHDLAACLDQVDMPRDPTGRPLDRRRGQGGDHDGPERRRDYTQRGYAG